MPDGPVHLVTKAEPELSPQTLAAAAGKSVLVSVMVSAAGSVRDMSIVTPSGTTNLDLAALSVAARSTYAPAETSCVASPGTVDVTVTY
jgi:TonB family protein